MKPSRKIERLLTDIFMFATAILVIASIFIYSSLINKTNLRVFKLESKIMDMGLKNNCKATKETNYGNI